MNFIISCLLLVASLEAFAWEAQLKKEIANIDANFPGEIGVVIKDLKNGKILEYNADQKWYLSSTMKVVVAVSLMEEVEKGRINLDQKVILKKEHFVDGAGRVLWSKPGEQFTVASLLEAMLQESDNTAADILISLIGKKELNKDFKKWMPEAGTATSLLDVRYLTYSELHPKAQLLSNMDYVILKNSPIPERPANFAKKIKVPVTELKEDSLERAHEIFYRKGYNSATLQSYVVLLEKLSQGKLLSNKNTNIILKHMKEMKTGENRLKAGLSREIEIMQKTGTQIHRACNMGLLKKKSDTSPQVAIAVCLTKPTESINSDVIFKEIGQKVSASPLI